MRFHVGIVDVSAAFVLLVVIFLPPRVPLVKAEYAEPVDTSAIGSEQAALARDPGDGQAAQNLAELLVEAGESDWALRMAGEAAQHEDSPTVWRAYLALSSVHVERFEIKEAYDYASLALDACEAEGADCPSHEAVRLQMYFNELEAGMEAIRAGIDPRAEPERFREAVNSAYPRAGFKPSLTPDKPEPESAPK